jgi:hypothetical protein
MQYGIILRRVTRILAFFVVLQVVFQFCTVVPLGDKQILYDEIVKLEKQEKLGISTEAIPDSIKKERDSWGTSDKLKESILDDEKLHIQTFNFLLWSVGFLILFLFLRIVLWVRHR